MHFDYILHDMQNCIAFDERVYHVSEHKIKNDSWQKQI